MEQREVNHIYIYNYINVYSSFLNVSGSSNMCVSEVCRLAGVEKTSVPEATPVVASAKCTTMWPCSPTRFQLP